MLPPPRRAARIKRENTKYLNSHPKFIVIRKSLAMEDIEDISLSASSQQTPSSISPECQDKRIPAVL